MTITGKLAEILSRSVSDNDRKRAALLLLDWTGCAVAGQAEPAGKKVTAAFADEAGKCTRIGATKSSPLMAALHNGCLGNVLEMDDVDKRAVLQWQKMWARAQEIFWTRLSLDMKPLFV